MLQSLIITVLVFGMHILVRRQNFSDMLLVSQQLPPAYTVEAKFWSCYFESFCDLPFQAAHFTMKWLLSDFFKKIY